LAVVDANHISDLIGFIIGVVAAFATFDDGDELSGVEIRNLEIVDLDPRLWFRLRLSAVTNRVEVLRKERRDDTCNLFWIGWSGWCLRFGRSRRSDGRYLRARGRRIDG
jgi:hypothetical protein